MTSDFCIFFPTEEGGRESGVLGVCDNAGCFPEASGSVDGVNVKFKYYCHMHWDTVKSIVSYALCRQSIAFIEYIGEKERRGCRMYCYSHS